MLVQLRYAWFAPSDKEGYAKGLNLTVSGRRYKKGIHETPEFLKDFLPADAEILNEKEAKKALEEKVDENIDIEALDLARAASDQLIEIEEKAEKTRKSYVKKQKVME